MKKTILITVASIACIAVWTSFFLFISDNNTEEAKSHEMVEVSTDQEISNVVIEESRIEEVDLEEIKEIDYSTRGIQLGDFDDIAPDKIISVEVLLDRIE